MKVKQSEAKVSTSQNVFISRNAQGGALCRAPCLAEEKNFKFQMVYKGQNNVRNYKFLAKYSF